MTGRSRSLAWEAMAGSVMRHGFALPHCPACGHLFYPPLRHCPRCLGGRIEFRPDSGRAVVLSTTCLHTTMGDFFRDKLPLYVANVLTDSGVTLFALATRDLPAGTRVEISMHPDGQGGGTVLHARTVNQDDQEKQP